MVLKEQYLNNKATSYVIIIYKLQKYYIRGNQAIY